MFQYLHLILPSACIFSCMNPVLAAYLVIYSMFITCFDRSALNVIFVTNQNKRHPGVLPGSLTQVAGSTWLQLIVNIIWF